MSAPQGSGPSPVEEERDLRTGSRRDFGVEVERDLTGSGRLARGGSTRFSTLRFRSAGNPAPEAAEPTPPARAVPSAKQVGRPSLGRRLLRMLGLG